MADSIKQQITDLRLLKKEEENIQALLKSRGKLDKDARAGLKEQLAMVQKLRTDQKVILDDAVAKLGITKKIEKAQRLATAGTQKVYSIETAKSQVAAAQNADTEEAKNLLEEMLVSQHDILKLNKESSIASYDYEDAMKEINSYEESIADKKAQGVEFTKDDMANMEDSLEIAKELAAAKQTEQAAQEVNNDTAENLLGLLGTSRDGLKGMVKGAKAFGLAFKAALGPIGVISIILGAIVGAVIAAHKFTGELRDELGVSQVQAGLMAVKLAPAAAALKIMGEDAVKLGSAFLSSFGTIDSVTNSVLLQAGNLRREFGASEESIAGLAKLFQDTMGGTISDNLDLIGQFGDQFESVGIAAGTALSEMADNALFLAEYMDGTVNSMVQATIEAKKLGLNLGTVSKITDGLLDMETSISNTMNASLLIGRQLNFDKARGLALEGKVSEAVADVRSQLGGVAEFQKLNVLQRRGLAEALGVGVDELGSLIRGEPVKVKSDPLINSNTQLIEALNNNTIQLGGEALVTQANENREIKSTLKKNLEVAEEQLIIQKQTKKNTGQTASLTYN